MRWFLAATTALTGAVAWPGIAAANPRGGTVVGGSASIAESAPGTLTVRQATDKAIIEWQDFSVGEREHTRFEQPSAGSIALNRVVGGNPSEILGRLSANGQVWLVNPNGIVFGRNAQVDVGGLVATTHDIRNDDFMAGRHRFEGAVDNAAMVENHGTITAAEAGLVALVAPGVANTGTITARLGEVTLASGRKFVVDLYGDQRINLATDAPVTTRPKSKDGKPADALVKNQGRVFADGGRVRMTAAAAKGVVDRVIDMSGIVQAHTVEEKDGEIILSGGDSGTVTVSGTLDATGAAPGTRGGTAVVTGERVEVKAGARIDVSGRASGGEALVGGDYLGGRATPQQLAGLNVRPARKPVPPARETIVEPGAVIAADATGQGKGGKAIVWSDGHTAFAGAISAKGGVLGGDGGFIEVSGRQGLGFHGLASVEAPRGLAGTVFFDPATLTISNGTTSVSGSLPNLLVLADETISAAALEAIGSGTIILTAADGITIADLTASGGDGQINLQNGVSLKLVTHDGTIAFANTANAIIASGTGSITMEAGYDSGTNYNGKLQNIGVLQTGSGNITLRGADGVALSGTLTTGGGSIDIDADGDQAGGGGFTSSVAITTNGGNLTVKAGSDGVTLNGNIALGAGGLTFSSTAGHTGTYTLGGQLSLLNDVTFTQPMTLNSGAGISTSGSIAFTNTVTMASGAGVTLTANGFSSTNTLDGQSGTLTLKPYDTTKTARVSGTANAGELDLTGILAKLSNFAQVNYNNASGTGGIAIGSGLSYSLPLSLTTGGTLSATGAVSVNSGQALTLAAPTLSIGGTLNGPAGITLSADSLTLGAADSLTSGGTVTLQPYSAGTNVFVNGTGMGLQLTSGILAAVASSVPSLVIGRSDSTGTVSVASSTSFSRNTTLRTGAGSITIDNAVSAGSNRLTLSATGGTVTQSAAITAAGLELLGSGGAHTLTNAGNAVTTLAGDTGTVTFSNNGSFTVGTANTVGMTVSGGLTLHAVSGDLTVAQSIQKSGSAAVGAALRADGSVITSGGADIQLAGGASNAFNVTINPDRDGNGQGAAILGSGTTVASNGGTIEIAGGSATDGSGLLTGAARGVAGRVDGIQLDGATLNAGGGSIVLRGTGADAANAAGVNLIGGSTVTTSGTGTITITGTSGTGAFSGLRGVNLGDSADSTTQTVSTAGGALAITGTAAPGATGQYAVGIRSQSGSLSSQGGTITLAGTASTGGTTDAYGIELNGRSATKSIASTSGAISLTGIGGGTSGANNWGIVQYGDFTIGATSGDVTLTATGGTGSLDYSNNSTGTANRIGNGTSGTVTINADTLSLDGAAVYSTGLVAIRPRSGSRAITLGSTTDAAAALELSDAELDRITAGTLRIGSTTSSAITVSAHLTPANATTLSMVTGSTYTQGTGITVTAPNIDISAAGTQTLNGTLSTTGGLTLTGNSLVVGGSLASTGTVTFQPYTASDSVSVAGSGGTLALATGILNAVASTATNLIIGRSDGTGAITVGPYAFSTNATLRNPGSGSAGISIGGALSVGTKNLTLDTTGTVGQSAAITAGGLELLGSGATYTLTNAGNAIGTLAGSTGTVTLTDSTSLTVGTVNTTGLTTSGALTLSLGTADTTLTTSQSVTAGGTTTLAADRMALGSALTAAGRTVTLQSTTSGRAIDLGSTTNAASALELSDTELDRITAGTLRIGSSGAGAITVSAAVSPANAATLSLITGQGVSQSGSGAITATNLRLSVGGAVSLGTNSNSVTTLAMAGSGNGALSFRGDTGFTIGTVDGVSGIAAGTGAVSLTSTGAVTQSQAITAGGLELLGTGGAYTLTNGGNAVGTIAGNTGSVSYTDAGTLTVGTVNTTGLSATGAVTLSADRMALNAALSASGQTVTLQSKTAGRAIDLGSTTDAASALEFSDTELDRVTAGTLRIGDSSAGAITVSAAVSPANTSTLSLITGQGVAQSGSGAITATNLRLSVGGAVSLGTNSNSVTTLAMAGSGNGALSFRGDTGFAIGTVDGVSGLSAGTGAVSLTSTGAVTQSQAITAGGLELLGTGGAYTLTNAGNAVGIIAGNTGSVSYTDAGTLTVGTVNTTGLSATGAVTLAADRMALNAALSASGQTVTLQSKTAGRAIDLGSTTDAASALEFSDTELDRVTAGTLRIGDSSAGAITVSAAVSPANAATLSLITGQGVAQSGSGAITATNLRLSVGGAVSLGTNSNSVTTLAMAGSGNGALSFRADAGFAIGTVDGVSGIAAGTGAVSLTSTGAVTQSQAITAGGLELLGTGGAYTLTNAGNAVATLSGSTGSVSYTDAGTLTVGTVNTTGLSATGAVTLSADRMALNAALSASGQTVTLQSKTAGRAIDLGSTTDAASALEFSDTELDRVTAGTLRIGNSGAGAITVSAAVSPANTSTLSLITGQGVSQSGSGAITATNLRLSVGGAVSLGTNSNSVTTLAMAGSGNGALSFRGDTGFAIGTVDGVSGLSAGTGAVSLTSTGAVTQSQAITAGGLELLGTGGAYTLTNAGNAVGIIAGNTGSVSYTDAGTLTVGTVNTTGLSATGAVTLSADRMALNAALSASGQTVTLQSKTAGRAIDLGSTTDAASALEFSDTELDRVTAGTLRIGDAGAGAITVSAAVSPANAATLSLITGQSVSQSGSGAITATNLRLSVGGAVSLGTNSNSVTTLAMAGSGNGALSFRGDTGFAIGTVDGVSGLSAGIGDVTLSTAGAVTQSQAITASGLSLKGTGGAYTLTNANNAVATLAGDTGTVNYTDADALSIGTVGGMAGLTVNGTTLSLATGGALTQTAALTNVGRLVLSAGGAIDLDESGVENTITALGSVTRGGAFSLYDSAGGLTLDGAVGAHASGVSIRTAGALTLSGNATVAASGAADIVLAAGGEFTNSRGSGALSLGTGRWLIYAATRDGSTEGGLSGTREYTRSYTANAPSTVTRSGNVFLYGNTPYITVRADDASRVYGDANPTLSASYSGVLSGDTASLAYTGDASLSTVGTDAAAGAHTITAGAGTLISPTGYGFRYETGTLTVTPALLTVNATARTKVYGDGDPTLAYTTSGLKGSDSAFAVLNGALSRTAGENVGSYTIGQGTLASNGNYTLSFTGGTLSITPAPLTIAATSASRTYGQDNPALTGTVTGLRNGDTAAGLGISYGTAATASSDVGGYVITPTAGALSNYTVSLAPGTLTVTPAPLTVTAEDATRTAGTANPPFTARYDGFVLGQGPGALGGTLSFTTAAGVDSPAGGYAVTPFGLASGNYAITYRPGTLAVTPAATVPAVSTLQVSTVIDRVANPDSLVPAVVATTAATTPPALVTAAVPQTPAATAPMVPGVQPSELLNALASGTLSALKGAEAASRAADAAASAVAVTLGGRTLSFSADAVAAHAAGQSLNLPSPALLNAPQVREAADRLLAAVAGGGMGKAMSAMSGLSAAEQKAAFQSVATAELINGLLTSDDSTARAVGGLLQSAVSGGGAGYADVKAAAKSGGVETPLLKTYLALYQHVDREQRTQTMNGAVQSLVADPHAADLFGRGGSGEPPRIVTLDAPRDAAGGRKVVEGRIEQSGRIREARVNGRWVFVDDQGHFSTDIAVVPGQNEVVLSVTDETGAITEKRIAVEATQASAPVADVPRAGRKIALMIATDTYTNPLIPPLKTPAGDVAAVGAALNERLGYETRVLANPTKAQIIETMRSLGREIGEQDQVMLYYAGHGYEVQETGTGYWLPADADADNPKNWVSNNDVARFLNRMPAKQILVVSDSCYSGAFTREQRVDPGVARTAPEQLLGRRSVMAMSSGGDEPVADGETNSPFAAAMITRMRQMPSDSGGYELFTQVRDDVTAEVPQTPQYGVIKAAGYDEGGDYLLNVKGPQRTAGVR